MINQILNAYGKITKSTLKNECNSNFLMGETKT